MYVLVRRYGLIPCGYILIKRLSGYIGMCEASQGRSVILRITYVRIYAGYEQYSKQIYLIRVMRSSKCISPAALIRFSQPVVGRYTTFADGRSRTRKRRIKIKSRNYLFSLYRRYIAYVLFLSVSLKAFRFTYVRTVFQRRLSFSLTLLTTFNTKNSGC